MVKSKCNSGINTVVTLIAPVSYLHLNDSDSAPVVFYPFQTPPN